MILGDLGIVVVIETINTGSAPAVSLPFVETADERVPRVRHQRRTDEDHQLNLPAAAPPAIPLCGWQDQDERRPQRRPRVRREAEDRPLVPPIPPAPTPSVLGWLEFDQHPPRRPRFHRRVEEDSPTLLIPSIPHSLPYVDPSDQRVPRRRRLRCREREQDDDGFQTIPVSLFRAYGHIGARQQ